MSTKRSSRNKKLTFTGERLIPGQKWLEELEIEHRNRYKFVQNFCQKSWDVLDIGSGEGYGSDMLSEKCRSVLGIDIDKAAVEFSSEKYKRGQKLNFRQMSATDIKKLDTRFDLIVSFELIEHLDKHAQNELLSQLSYVLKKDGLFVVSTPNVKEYRKGEKKNKFHKHELNYDEFENLLRNSFKHVLIFGQSNQFSNNITTTKAKGNEILYEDADYVSYYIAICSNKTLRENHNVNHLNISSKVVSYYSSDTLQYLKQQIKDYKKEVKNVSKSWRGELTKREGLWKMELEKQRSEYEKQKNYYKTRLNKLKSTFPINIMLKVRNKFRNSS